MHGRKEEVMQSMVWYRVPSRKEKLIRKIRRQKKVIAYIAMTASGLSGIACLMAVERFPPAGIAAIPLLITTLVIQGTVK